MKKYIYFKYYFTGKWPLALNTALTLLSIEWIRFYRVSRGIFDQALSKLFSRALRVVGGGLSSSSFIPRIDHKFSIGERSGLLAGHIVLLQKWGIFSVSSACVATAVWGLAPSCWKTILDMFGTSLQVNLEPPGTFFLYSFKEITFQHLGTIVNLIHTGVLWNNMEGGEPREGHGAPHHNLGSKLRNWNLLYLLDSPGPNDIILWIWRREELVGRFVGKNNLFPIIQLPVLDHFTEGQPVFYVFLLQFGDLPPVIGLYTKLLRQVVVYCWFATFQLFGFEFFANFLQLWRFLPIDLAITIFSTLPRILGLPDLLFFCTLPFFLNLAHQYCTVPKLTPNCSATLCVLDPASNIPTAWPLTSKSYSLVFLDISFCTQSCLSSLCSTGVLCTCLVAMFWCSKT